jgi:hypothetical protein
MTLRQQIVQDHIDKTALKLGLSADQAFLVFAHSIFTDRSMHSFDQNDNVDGGQDKQIDVITVDDDTNEATIYISQIKNEESFSSNSLIQKGSGSFSLEVCPVCIKCLLVHATPSFFFLI